MTEKQKALLLQLANTFNDLAEECMNDDVFHDVMIENNHLVPMSLDELSAEWFAVVEENK